MSLQVLHEDQSTIDVVYAPGRYTFTRDKVGTRYMFAIIRKLADPKDPADVKQANLLQDAIRVEQSKAGSFGVPKWDMASQGKARDALLALGAPGGTGTMFGRREAVDPVSFLIGPAAGWGGNPPEAAIHNGVFPEANDGRTVHRLNVKDVPVDGLRSISVHSAKGFFEENELDAYSLNNLAAKPAADGSYTVQFGGCDGKVPKCLPTMPGWNCVVRTYRPRASVLNGSWGFPQAKPVP